MIFVGVAGLGVRSRGCSFSGRRVTTFPRRVVSSGRRVVFGALLVVLQAVDVHDLPPAVGPLDHVVDGTSFLDHPVRSFPGEVKFPTFAMRWPGLPDVHLVARL